MYGALAVPSPRVHRPTSTKGFHTLRNKHMRLEKLTYSFCLKTRQFLSLQAGPGDQSLFGTVKTLLLRLMPRLRGAGRGSGTSLNALFSGQRRCRAS